MTAVPTSWRQKTRPFMNRSNRILVLFGCVACETKQKKCPARVRQTKDGFKQGRLNHNHAPDSSKKNKIIITQKATQYASQQIFSAASGIVENVASEVITSTYIEHPKLDHIMRGVNRKRQRLRLEDPQTIYFELQKDYIPEGFFKGEIRVGGMRHLIFATYEHLRLLKTSLRWYLDGTFKVVRKPFDNLLSVHAFARRGNCA
ncbi:uncharacterized protein LOC127876247 [Dreissena polymorpha]|uniref:uncharacterized protein LOC127876247 n=1 Tax=Dreissena polymorpha TaxID=45954 RepID=UPI0022645FBF|nr:uncharacterized protein LOC127876247 [Dreissena polymorpha]